MRYSDKLKSENWYSIVLGDLLKDKGMVSFSRYLTKDDSDAIRAYVIERNLAIEIKKP